MHDFQLTIKIQLITLYMAFYIDFFSSDHELLALTQGRLNFSWPISGLRYEK